ncbi:hypothetical protein [Beduinella massiliensis]|uniref:portal protein n=1 Tax=Beduinella massiliensis TaxID=1852363 RepID=UPI000C821064
MPRRFFVLAVAPRETPRLNTLNATVDNVVADQMDNLPEAKMMPERPELQESADILTDVVRYALYQSAFDEQYAQLMEDCAVTGSGVLQIFWDEELDDGRGMARCERWDMESFYPDPMFSDIQEGRAVFKTAFYPREWYEQHYPEKARYIGGDTYWEPRAGYTPEGGAPILLIEYWWRTYDKRAKRYSVHMAQIAGGALLYRSHESVYSHGRYPVVLVRYRRQQESAFGIGLMDDYADQWRATCRYAGYIDENARASSRQRFIYREDSGLDGKALADWSRDFIGARGAIDEGALRSFQAAPLNPQIMNFMAYLVDTMKQDSGQNQFSRGEAGLGVTAASAIQALQEAGGKITRLHTAGYMESFRQAVEQMIYVLSDRITEERVIMVAGQDSAGTLRPRHVKLLPARPSLPEAGMPGQAMPAMGAGQDGAEAGMPGQAMPAMGAGQDGAMGALAGLNGDGAEADIAAALQSALGGAEAGMAAMGTGRAIERPPYNVRVQIQRRSPLQIQANNEFVLQVAQICGQAGQPLPPLAVVSLLQGIDNKQEVLSALREADQTRTQMQQLQGAVEQLQGMLEQEAQKTERLKRALMSQKDMIKPAQNKAAAGRQDVAAPEGELPPRGEAAGRQSTPGAVPQDAGMQPPEVAPQEAGMQPMPEAAPQGDAAGPEQEADAKMQALAQMLGSMQAGQA